MGDCKVLWIEDGALYELAHLAGPVYLEGGYELTVAENVSEAVTYIQNKEFDAIIVDIRLPPGENHQWIDLYEQAGQQKATASLGLKLLKSILNAKDAEIQLENLPSWLIPAKIGILTVESKNTLQQEIDKLGIQVFENKFAGMPDSMLLDIIVKICRSQN